MVVLDRNPGAGTQKICTQGTTYSPPPILGRSWGEMQDDLPRLRFVDSLGLRMRGAVQDSKKLSVVWDVPISVPKNPSERLAESMAPR